MCYWSPTHLKLSPARETWRNVIPGPPCLSFKLQGNIVEKMCGWNTMLSDLCLHRAVQTAEWCQTGPRSQSRVTREAAVILWAVWGFSLVHVRYFPRTQGRRHDFINLQKLHTLRQDPNCTVDMQGKKFGKKLENYYYSQGRYKSRPKRLLITTSSSEPF